MLECFRIISGGRVQEPRDADGAVLHPVLPVVLREVHEVPQQERLHPGSISINHLISNKNIYHHLSTNPSINKRIDYPSIHSSINQACSFCLFHTNPLPAPYAYT